MIDTLNYQPWNPIEEVLQLECPGCGGMLNLKRRFLGVKGQCVHCQIPLVGVEEGGVPRASSDAVTSSEKVPTVVSHGAVPTFPGTSPVLREDSSTSAGQVVAPFQSFAEVMPVARAAQSPNAPDPPAFPNFSVEDFGACLPIRDGEPLFSGRKELPITAPPVGGTNAVLPGFGELGGFPPSFSPSASGAAELEAIGSFFPPSFAAGGIRNPELPAAALGGNHAPRDVVAPHGDWHPVKQTSRGDRNGLAVYPFGPDNARTKTARLARWRKRTLHFIAFLCLIGAIGAIGAIGSFLVPRETLGTWKKEVTHWLEPGMPLLDYLPSGLRPEWLTSPQTVSDTDAGGIGRPQGNGGVVAGP